MEIKKYFSLYFYRHEAKVIKNNLMATEICWSFEGYVPRICIFVTIMSFIMFGNDINAKTAYIVTAYYNVLRNSLYRTLPLSKFIFNFILLFVKIFIFLNVLTREKKL